MKVLILAAGRGTRISRYLSGNPKCMVNIGDEILIRYTIKLFYSKGIRDIVISLGYRGDVIKEALKDFPDLKYCINPFYDVTNSIASAWFAQDFLSSYDDTLIMNGDVFLEDKLLDHILQEKRSPVMFADNRRKEEADYKFLYENNILKKYGKELEGSDVTGEYIGIGKFEKSFMPHFVEELNKHIDNQSHSIWWENIVYDLVGKEDIYVSEIEEEFWAEVDYVEDYERILNFRGYNINLKSSLVGTPDRIK